MVTYDDIKVIPLSIKRKVYGGEAKDSIELSGDISIKNADSVVVKYDQTAKIRKIQTTVDQNTQTLTIVAEQTEGNTKDISGLKISLEGIETEVSKTSNSIYKFETGHGNIFDNCHKLLSKNINEPGIKYINDMPLGINKDYIQNKDICISVDIQVMSAIIGNLDNYIGAEFEVGYVDGTKKLYSTRWYLGQYNLQYLLQTSTVDHEERIWAHFKIEDKEITSVSNLKMIIAFDCEKAIVANPKVEFGVMPTGFEFDVNYIRDNVETIQKDYTEIKQEVGSLSLKAVSMEEQITTIKGNVSSIETRVQSTEFKLTPTEITAMVNEKIGTDGELTTVKVTINKYGLDVKNGAISITNNSGVKVLYADTNGDLVGNKITINDLQSTSGKIGKLNIDTKGFNYSENLTVNGKACTFALKIQPDARDSFMNWVMKTNDGSADDIVGALTYSGIECNSVTAIFMNADDLYATSINGSVFGAEYVNVSQNLRVVGTTNLNECNITGQCYVRNSKGQAISMKRIADLVG